MKAVVFHRIDDIRLDIRPRAPGRVKLELETAA